MTGKNANTIATYNRLHALAVFLIVCFLFLSFWDFLYQNTTYTKQTSQAQLKEVAVRTSQTVQLKMNTSLKYIESAANSIAQFDDIHSPEALSLLGKLAEDGPFVRMRIANAEGVCYQSDGNMIQTGDREYFKFAMNGQTGISKVVSSLYNQENIIVLYTPIYQNGVIVGTIHGIQQVNSLSGIVDIASFSGSGYSYIFEKTGSIIQSSVKNRKGLANNTNMLKFFDSLQFANGFNAAKIREDIRTGAQDFTSYYYDDELRTAYYMPIGVQGWYFLQIIPESVIREHVIPINQMATILTLKVLAVFAFMIIGIIIVSRKAQKELRLNNERFHIAMSHTANRIFEYNPRLRTIDFLSVENGFYQIPLSQKEALDYLVEKKLVDIEYANVLWNAFEEITKGMPMSEVVVKTTNLDGNYVWEKITLTNILDYDGKSLRAVGTSEDITEAKDTQLRYAKEEQYREAMFSDALAIYEINLSQDKFKIVMQQAANLVQEQDWVPYQATLLELKGAFVFNEDQERFQKASDINYLLNSFRSGRKEVQFEYRRISSPGQTNWVCSTSNLLKDPFTGDIMAFVYIKDIEKQKSEKLKLQYNAEHDAMTGLYNRAAMEQYITEFLTSADSRTGCHGFFILDLDGFKGINDTYGHMMGDEILKEVADHLSTLFRTTDVVSRMGGDEFSVFLKDVGSMRHIIEKADELCRELKKIQIVEYPQIRISATVGIAIAPQQGKTFLKLYEKSDQALYFAKSQGKGSFHLWRVEDTRKYNEAKKLQTE